MKHNIIQTLILLFCASTTMLAVACGDDDKQEEKSPAPQLLSTTPANGTTGIDNGAVEVAFNYDVNIVCDLTKVTSIGTSGCTLDNVHVSGKSLLMTAAIPEEGGTVTISIPTGFVMNTQRVAAEGTTLTFSVKSVVNPVPLPADGHETATQAVANMGPGWNLGNTLDAWGSYLGYGQSTDKYETCWGQPVADAHLMKALKTKGFGAIRVPVTWFQNMDDNGQVREAWMKRVEEVVNYVLDQGMYCILNVHHDTGAGSQAWLKADNDTYSAVQQRYQSLWTQIANHFKDYSEKLLFEGYNEMLAGTDPNAQWTEPKSTASYDAINKFAKLFVETVRATGGGNLYRNLIITTYSAAHTQRTVQALTIPGDPCGNQSHLAIEVHSYDPWDWVNTYNMTWTSACTTELKNMFALLNTTFIQKGYPVIVGEYGSNGNGEKTINGSSTNAQKAEAGRQAGDMSRLCRKYNAAAFYWMGLIDGKDRAEATFKWTMEQVADSIVNVYK